MCIFKLTAHDSYGTFGATTFPHINFCSMECLAATDGDGDALLVRFCVGALVRIIE